MAAKASKAVSPPALPSPPRATGISLGRLLLTTSLGLTVLAAGIVGMLSYRGGRQAVDEAVGQFSAEIGNRIGMSIGDFLASSRRIAEADAAAIARGVPDSRDQAELARYFWDQLQLFGMVNSIYFGNGAGGLANAGREGENGSQYAIFTDGFAAGRFRKFATDSSGRPGALVSSLPDFDSRKRAWYQNAVLAGGTVWSSPYVLFTGQDLAISASRPVSDGDGRLLGVVSVDVFLSHLGSRLAHLEVGKTGQSFIMERSGLLIATSTGELPFGSTKNGIGFERVMAEHSSNRITRRAAAALADTQSGEHRFDGIKKARAFDFREKDGRYLGRVGLFQDPAGLDWLVVTVFPENDFMAGINSSYGVTGLLMLLATIVVALAVIVVTGKIASPIKNLTARVQNLGLGDWTDIPPGQSHIRELTILSGSFAEMAGMLKQMVEGLKREVEERKRAQASLAIARDQADSASRAKSEFIAGITHELRTPLTAILGFTELLENTPLDDTQRRHLRTIDASKQALLGIIDEVLDFSRLESGAFRLETRGTDLGRLLDEIAAEGLHLARGKNLSFVYSPRPSFPGLAEVDPARLRQVLASLLDNAVKFTERGEVELAARHSPGPPGWGRVTFLVRDTGIGISGHKLAEIEQPFSQADGSTTRSHGGIGLSLYLARLLVHRMGGTIQAHSEPGKGSAFEFSLDLVFRAGELPQDRVHASLLPLVQAEGQRARTLPADLVSRLREASSGGDIGQLLSIMEELGKTDPQASGRLGTMLELFDYDAIEKWLEEMESDNA